MQRDKAIDRATIEASEKKTGTLSSLPQDRLDRLFTVGGIKLGRLTGGDHWNSSKTGDDGIKVEVVPLDQQGEKLKAAGSFVIDAFDLAQSDKLQVGHWAFDVAEARHNWYGGLLYAYVLKCPWQTPPSHGELTLKVTFTDELTGRSFIQQQLIKVHVTAAVP